MEEIWKDIQGFEGLYQVSNLGNVKRVEHITKYNQKLKVKILKCYLAKGYPTTTLYKNGKYKSMRVARMVAEAFIPNFKKSKCVHTKDGNHSNVHLNNLYIK